MGVLPASPTGMRIAAMLYYPNPLEAQGNHAYKE